MEQIRLELPNEDAMLVDMDVISAAKIREPKLIGDTVFFWMNDTYVSVPEDDFRKIMDAPSV